MYAAPTIQNQTLPPIPEYHPSVRKNLFKPTGGRWFSREARFEDIRLALDPVIERLYVLEKAQLQLNQEMQKLHQEFQALLQSMGRK
jgi:hypothetical protein